VAQLAENFLAKFYTPIMFTSMANCKIYPVISKFDKGMSY